MSASRTPVPQETRSLFSLRAPLKLCLILFIGCAMSLRSVQAQPDASNPRSHLEHEPLDVQSAAHRRGALLVKVTEEAAQAIERARTQGTLPVIEIESLDALIARYKVRTIEPVFPQSQDPDTIKAKFPERAKRAPPDTEPPVLSSTYFLSIDPAADAGEAARAFSGDPHVDYAQPDYRATVNATPEAP